MPSSHRFSDPAEENNILNHVISEDLQKYGFMYLSFHFRSHLSYFNHIPPFITSPLFTISFLISSALYLPSHSSLSSFYLYFHLACHKYFYTYYSPEFIGRIPRIVPLHPLTENDLVRIIQDPEDSLLSQVPPFTSIMLFAYLANRGNF